MSQKTAVETLIEVIPENARVLDVGCGGLHGKNTSTYLANRFKPRNILGVCTSKKETDVFNARRAEAKVDQIRILNHDFYTIEFNEKFDLVVLDLNVENNVQKDWSIEGMERISKITEDGGYLLLYVMMTDQYGDENSSRLLREHLKDFWEEKEFTNEMVGKKIKKLKNWELFAAMQEERRPYITWVLLKKTSGS